MSASNLEAAMDGMTRQQKFKMILTLLAHEAKRNSPDGFRAFVVGLLGNCVNGMSDSVFGQFCMVHRCDQIDCDCHVMAEETCKFLKLLREDVKKELSRRCHRCN